MTFTVSKLLLLIAVICFVLAFLGISAGGHSLVALGLAFFAGAEIV